MVRGGLSRGDREVSGGEGIVTLADEPYVPDSLRALLTVGSKARVRLSPECPFPWHDHLVDGIEVTIMHVHGPGHEVWSDWPSHNYRAKWKPLDGSLGSNWDSFAAIELDPINP